MDCLPLPSLKNKFYKNMIVIDVKDNESIDRALKRFKKKFEKTGAMRQLRKRQAYEKKSIARRQEILKAVYKESLLSGQN